MSQHVLCTFNQAFSKHDPHFNRGTEPKYLQKLEPSLFSGYKVLSHRSIGFSHQLRILFSCKPGLSPLSCIAFLPVTIVVSSSHTSHREPGHCNTMLFTAQLLPTLNVAAVRYNNCEAVQYIFPHSMHRNSCRISISSWPQSLYYSLIWWRHFHFWACTCEETCRVSLSWTSTEPVNHYTDGCLLWLLWIKQLSFK